MIQDKIIDIVAAQSGKNKTEITAATTFDSLSLDSLDRVEIIMKVEEEFSVEMSDEKVDTIHTVGALAEYVESLKK